jgi:hypothetical protein
MRQRVITVTVLVAALIALWRFWPSDERRIQQLVQEIAVALQPVNGETDVARVTRLAPLVRGLAADVVVEGPAPAVGREQVVASVMQMARLAPHLSIVVRNIDVSVEPARAAARALVTVAITGEMPGATDVWRDITELEIGLTRHDDVWTVSRVAPVSPLRP